MKKTLTFNLTLDELDISRAQTVLAENGLTVESLLSSVLERTAREGAIPLKKRASHPRKKSHTAEMPGLFVQGDLFETLAAKAEAPARAASFALVTTDYESADPNESEASEASEALHPTLPTITSLQEAQAMLRWRQREREASQDASLTLTPGSELTLIETKQFRLDKVLIAQSPMMPAIIATLEGIFTELSHGVTPSDAIVTDDGKSWYVPLTVDGIPNGTLGLLYEPGIAEVCMVRYGKPEDILRNPPNTDSIH